MISRAFLLCLALTACGGAPGPAPARSDLLACDPAFAALERSIEVRPGHTLELRLAAGSTRLEVRESFGPEALEAALPGVWTLKPSLRRGAESSYDGLRVTLDGEAYRPLAALSEARSVAREHLSDLFRGTGARCHRRLGGCGGRGVL